MAPELGLFLDECYYDSYNTQFGKLHGEIHLSDFQSHVDAFKVTRPGMAGPGWVRQLCTILHSYQSSILKGFLGRTCLEHPTTQLIRAASDWPPPTPLLPIGGPAVPAHCGPGRERRRECRLVHDADRPLLPFPRVAAGRHHQHAHAPRGWKARPARGRPVPGAKQWRGSRRARGPRRRAGRCSRWRAGRRAGRRPGGEEDALWACQDRRTGGRGWCRIQCGVL